MNEAKKKFLSALKKFLEKKNQPKIQWINLNVNDLET